MSEAWFGETAIVAVEYSYCKNNQSNEFRSNFLLRLATAYALPALTHLLLNLELLRFVLVKLYHMLLKNVRISQFSH